MTLSRRGTHLVAALIAFSLVACARDAEGPRSESFRSEALGRTMRYQIVVPDGASAAPVVYLLHGYGGDETDWFLHSGAAAVARRLGLVVVTPDGGNSWYTNSATEAWEDYVNEDLIAEVERRFPVSRTRQGRAVAGLSMGGYGAMKLALRHPDRFALAASMGGALDITRPTSVFNPDGTLDNVTFTFGAPGDSRREANNVYRLASMAAPDTLPYLWVDCGLEDPWLDINREFAAILRSGGLPHEFHERPGGHDWSYWDRQIVDVLELAARRLR